MRYFLTRPILTSYNGGERSTHSCTVRNALVAATRRIVLGDYTEALIYSLRGIECVRVKRTPMGIRTEIKKGALR